MGGQSDWVCHRDFCINIIIIIIIILEGALHKNVQKIKYFWSHKIA